MRNKLLVICTTLFMSFPTFAIGLGNDNPSNIGGITTQENTQTTVLSNHNSLVGETSSTAKSTSSTSSNQTVSSTLGGGTLNYNNKTEKNTPSVVMSNIMPTAPCMGSSSVGGSGVGFGISVGSSWTDNDCTKRETARSFAALGLNEDAVAILCSSEAAAVAPSCKAKAVATE